MTTLKVTKHQGTQFEEVREFTGKNKKEVNSMYVQKWEWMYKDKYTIYEYIKS